MASANTSLIYDGIGPLSGGMDSGKAPLLLPKSKAAYASNTTFRGDFATDRPPTKKLNLDFGGDLDLQNSFEKSLWQEAINYVPDTGSESIIASIGGRLFKITPDNNGNASVVDISIPDDPNPAGQTKAWMVQAENYVIVNDGISLPLFYDGSTTWRSIGIQEIVLGTTAADFTVPDIGSTVSVTLTGDYLGTFGETIILHGATYQVVTPRTINQPTLKNVDAPPGTVYPPGTVVQYDPGIATVYKIEPSGPISIPDGTSFPLGIIIVEPPFTGPVGTIFNWLLIDHGYYNWTVLDKDSTSVSLKFNLFSDPGGVLSGNPFPYNSLMYYKTSPGPVQNVGTLSAGYNAPDVDASSQASFLNAYSGPTPPVVLTIGVDHYIITSAGTGTPSNTLTLLNINDTPGQTVTAPSNLISIPQLPAGKMIAYGMGRLWDVMTDGISFLAGDIVGGASGTPSLNYRDAVLNVTENAYLAGGGLFRVPGAVGSITGLLFTATLDRSLGQGPLQVFTQRNVFSCQTPVDRTTWQTLTNPILTEALKGAGGAGQDGLLNTNADIIFRSPDGQLRSLILSRLDFNRWGDTPISNELEESIRMEDKSLMGFCSAIEFDNRALFTANPVQTTNGVVWSNLYAINFDTISSLQSKSSSVYDGIWSGPKILKLVRFDNSNRAFAFCMNTSVNSIELHELLPTGSSHLDNGTVPITWQVVSPCFFSSVPGKGLFDLARLADGEIYFSDLKPQERVEVTVKYRPDWSPCWYPWTSFYVCSSASPANADQYRSRIGLGAPNPTTCVSFNKKPAREGRFFQIQLTFVGHCVFQGIKLGAVPIPESRFEPPLCNASSESGPITTPRYWNELVYYDLPECSSGYPIYYSGPTPPDWIALDYIHNRFAGFPDNFIDDSQAGANSAAQSALNAWVNEQIDGGYFTCISGYIALKDDEVTSLLGTDALQMRFANDAFFLTRSSANAIFRSEDGTTWTEPVSGEVSLIYDVAYGNGIYVAVGAHKTGPTAMPSWTSSDGMTWVRHDDTSGGEDIYTVAFGGGKFVGISNFGNPRVSIDGINWTNYSSLLGSSNCRKIQYLNDKFFACFDGHVYSASDPTGAWADGALTGYTFRDIAYGNGTYIAVGYHTVSAHHQAFGATSSDGLTWTPTDLTGETELLGIAFLNDSFAACAQSGKVYFSNNGSGWFQNPNTADSGLNNIATDGMLTLVAAEGSVW